MAEVFPRRYGVIAATFDLKYRGFFGRKGDSKRLIFHITACKRNRESSIINDVLDFLS